LVKVGPTIRPGFSKLKLIKTYLKSTMRQTNEPCSCEHRAWQVGESGFH